MIGASKPTATEVAATRGPVARPVFAEVDPRGRVLGRLKRELAICFTGAPAHECELAIARSARIPFQEIVDPGWLAVFVDTKDADIEIEARIFEIIWVAAVKGHLLFRRENDSHIIIAFVTIKMIRPALIKRH